MECVHEGECVVGGWLRSNVWVEVFQILLLVKMANSKLWRDSGIDTTCYQHIKNHFCTKCAQTGSGQKSRFYSTFASPRSCLVDVKSVRVPGHDG